MPVHTAPASSKDSCALFSRFDDNPILTPKMWPYPINSVFNPGAVTLANGEILLLCRVEDRRGLSHLCAARSADGISDWRIDDKPTFTADPENHPEETWGIEDPRITFLPELDQYAVTYTSYAERGPGASLALTKDFRKFERRGVLMTPENKDQKMSARATGCLLIITPCSMPSSKILAMAAMDFFDKVLISSINCGDRFFRVSLDCRWNRLMIIMGSKS